MEANNQCNPGETNAHGQYTQAYVSILDTYKDQINKSVNKKNELKTNFFWLISIIMVALTILFIVSIYWSFTTFKLMITNDYQSVSVIVGAVTGMITTLSTMILSIFKLPEIVAEYLFNKKEDDQMVAIIKNIQEYELQAVKVEKLAIMEQEKEIANIEEADEPLAESSNTSYVQPESSSGIIGQSRDSSQTADMENC